jgi:hypothetical protein
MPVQHSLFAEQGAVSGKHPPELDEEVPPLELDELDDVLLLEEPLEEEEEEPEAEALAPEDAFRPALT